MCCKQIGIATAKITGLYKKPKYFSHRNCYACEIMFSDSSTLSFSNLPYILAGNTYEEAEKFQTRLKLTFKSANIYNKDTVAVMFEQSTGSIIAIGSIAQDCWIDVNDNFTKKTFKELGINITSLKVH